MEVKLKQMNYVDPSTGEYVTVDCKLKEGVDKEKMNAFFSNIYRARLDGSYDQTFLADNYHSGNLVQAFKNVLEHETLDSIELLEVTRKENEIAEPIMALTVNFFEMFDYSNEQRISNEEHTFYMTQVFKKAVLGKEQARKMINGSYNGQLFRFINYTPTVAEIKKSNAMQKSFLPSNIVAFRKPTISKQA